MIQWLPEVAMLRQATLNSTIFLADTDKKIWDANCNIELSTCHLLLSKERRTGSQKYVGIFKLQRGMNGCLATFAASIGAHFENVTGYLSKFPKL